MFILCNTAVSWKTKNQTTISLSSTEAEYVALSEATKEAIWMKQLLREIKTRYLPKGKVNLAEYHEVEIERQWKPWRNDDEDNSEKETKTNDQLTTLRPQKIKADN